MYARSDIKGFTSHMIEPNTNIENLTKNINLKFFIRTTLHKS